jgi:uncharacterized protein YqjF (DUF2071 family)
MYQSWHDLLFMHWPVAHDQLRLHVPEPLPLDTFDGQCWVGVVPFHMSNLRARWLPPVPGLSRTPELNLRTYVTVDGKPGVYFFSLDIALLSAVFAARSFFRLPYFYARFRLALEAGEIFYACERGVPANMEFECRYAPVNEAARSAAPGTLEHWLTERYCLYTVTGRSVFRAEIQHLPWPLQNAEGRLIVSTIAEAAGLRLPDRAPLLHFARRQDVLVWPLKRV